VFWLNRPGAPAEELGVTPHGTGRNMNELIAFIENQTLPEKAEKNGKREKSSRTRHSPDA